jgi:hypothetical protein
MGLKRNLSGIYIFEKYENENKREPTCFEDCMEDTQDKWLDTLDGKALKELSKRLAICIRGIGEEFNIIRK